MLQMTDQIEAMQKAWAEGLNTASQNFQSADGTMQSEKNTATEGGVVKYSSVVDLSSETELKERIGDLKGAKKYKVISNYIIEKLGKSITFSDGFSAIIDNSDANHIAHDAADKKTAEISAVERLVKSAVLYAYDENADHNKFDYFKYYIASVKLWNEAFPVYFNIGRGKYDGKFHFYDLTNKIRDTARRINGVERPRGFLSENGISNTTIRNDSEKIKMSDEKIFSARQEESYSTKSILTQLNAETVSQLDADGKKLLQSYQRMAKQITTAIRSTSSVQKRTPGRESMSGQKRNKKEYKNREARQNASRSVFCFIPDSDVCAGSVR